MVSRADIVAHVQTRGDAAVLEYTARFDGLTANRVADLELTQANFASQLKGDLPLLVDFWADWCGPCKMIAPALEEISEELAGKVVIAKMDIMENTDTPSQIGVQSIPLMVLFKNGEPVAQKLGAAPKSQLKGWLESVL